MAKPERNREVLKAKSVLAFRLLALILIGVAIYKPYIKTQVAAPARDYLFIVDVSKSMAAEDSGQDSRLETAKKAITEVSKNARGKLALILYAKEALTPSVFTDDYPAFSWIIKNWVNIESAPGGGTDIYPPLKLVLSLIENTRKNLGQKNWKPLTILFSDGGGFYQEDDEVKKIVKAINKNQMPILTVGLGDLTGAPIPIEKRGDETRFLEHNGNLVITALDEIALREFTDSVKGSYLRLVAGQEKRLLKEIRAPELNVPVEKDVPIYYAPLLLSIMLFLVKF